MNEPSAVQNLGGHGEYVLGMSEVGWWNLPTVRWHAVEEIARPFRYDITAMRDATLSPLDLDKMLGAGASFRIRAQGRWRVIHGIIAEAEEIERTAVISLYRVALVPPIWRARYRIRCRTFVDQTVEQIVTAVLENRSPAHPTGLNGLVLLSGTPAAPEPQPSFATFTEPGEAYRWDVGASSRIKDATLHPYVVQYSETDFDFLSRLLEQEGLSYYFEHSNTDCIMTITDAPGRGALFGSGDLLRLRANVQAGGRAQTEELVRTFRDTRRMKSRSVTMRDFDYHRSLSLLEATSLSGSVDPDLAGHFEFPAGDDYVKAKPGAFPAQIRLERHDVERELRDGSSTARALSPGCAYKLHDADQLREDVDLLMVRVETYATEGLPQGTILDHEPFGFDGASQHGAHVHENRFSALPITVPFRPAMLVQKPRIHGVQTALVTAEEIARSTRPEINADSLGCVRVRFPWDQRADADDGTPSSCWVRVSHYWAGPAFGALYNPRVGHEVLVAYREGDPDRPIVVGRVYNAQNQPPYDPSIAPTKSTVKSQSSPKAKGSNEFRFEDAAGKEEIYLHAQRDLNEVVLASHTTQVDDNQSNTVHKDRTHTVDGTETVRVHGDRNTHFNANEYHLVDGSRTTEIDVNESHTVHAYRHTIIAANDDLEVGGWRNTKVTDGESIDVGGKRDVKVVADQTSTANNHKFTSADTFQIEAGGSTLSLTKGAIFLSNGSASISIIGGLVSIAAGSAFLITSKGPVTAIAQDTVNIAGTSIKLNE